MADSLLKVASKEQLEDLADSLEALERHQGWALVYQHFSDLESRSLRSLESAVEARELFRLQGEVRAYRSARNVIGDLLRQVRQGLKTDEVIT